MGEEKHLQWVGGFVCNFINGVIGFIVMSGTGRLYREEGYYGARVLRTRAIPSYNLSTNPDPTPCFEAKKPDRTQTVEGRKAETTEATRKRRPQRNY